MVLPPPQQEREIEVLPNDSLMPPVPVRRPRKSASSPPQPSLVQGTDSHQDLTRPPPPTRDVARQGHIEPTPGAYRVSPGRYVTRASVASSAAESLVTRTRTPMSSQARFSEGESVPEAVVSAAFLVEATPIDAETATVVNPPTTAPLAKPFPLLEPAVSSGGEDGSSQGTPAPTPSPRKQQHPERRRRRRALLLVCVGAVVVGAAVAGGVGAWVATRSEEPEPEASRDPPLDDGGADIVPTSAPSSSPTPNTRCSSQSEAWLACIRSTGDLPACQTCAQSYYPNVTESCEQSAIVECGLEEACQGACGSCQVLQVAYVSCLNEELCAPITCPEPTPTQTVPPTAAPTLPECPDEDEAYWKCVAEYNQGDSTACRECRNDFIPDEGLTCANIAVLACEIARVCSVCGPCQDQELAYANCLNKGECDPITCSSPSTATSPPSAAPST
jgi:hypothetical protein